MSVSALAQVLIGGEWREGDAVAQFQASNPRTREPVGPQYPVCSRKDLDEVLRAAAEAAKDLCRTSPNKVAKFLDIYADGIESNKEGLVEAAHEETALPKSPRLADIELPRTTSQLRQAALAVADRSWTMPTIDTESDIRSMYGPLGGPVAVFGPNNFPFAFNSIAGGDFAAAIAARNPVIAKANPGHPRTTELFGRIAFEAVRKSGLPRSSVQLIYQMAFQEGEWFVSHPLIAATAFTGSRTAGLALKAAADSAGKLLYMETGSVNPVLVLPGALEERMPEIAEELTTSCLLGTGQFCTQPGLVIVLSGDRTDEFITEVARRFDEAPVGTLLGHTVEENLTRTVECLVNAGAERVTGGSKTEREAFSFENTVLRVHGIQFLDHPLDFQLEAFGNETLFVVAENEDQILEILEVLEGSLTGSIYSSLQGKDDVLYERVELILRTKVGRFLNDKMPTGVAVCPAMHHGGPYPATSHPGFTAVGIPPALLRFAALHCYDNVREYRLPPELRDKNPTGKMWRQVDGKWTQS
jgi:NADP-dependent aldehyde dehydrogenase